MFLWMRIQTEKRINVDDILFEEVNDDQTIIIPFIEINGNIHTINKKWASIRIHGPEFLHCLFIYVDAVEAFTQ